MYSRTFAQRPPAWTLKGLKGEFPGILLAILMVLLCGCATRQTTPSAARRFEFTRDTFAYANDLVWEYAYNEQGQWTAKKRVPKPDYTLHCFVVARAAKQFFQNARFEPDLPVVNDKRYAELVRRVVCTNPRESLPGNQKIIIPGYADLRQFSAEKEALLKKECGKSWESYFQRGHWRMIFPFSHHHQEDTAHQLYAEVKAGSLAVVHLATFPQLSINHAIVVFDATETLDAIVFSIYDPNDPSKPGELTFTRKARNFVLPQNSYFSGGDVNVYQVYHHWLY
jgi:hypothetical protein